MIYFTFFLLNIFFPSQLTQANISKINNNNIVNSFLNINTSPKIVTCNNSLESSICGGHLQGIQLMNYAEEEYIILSGSSKYYSYYSIIKLGEINQVLSINKIFTKPFSHAGGFQLYNDYLAIGIEDNFRRDRSKICIFKIKNPRDPPQKPIAIIERKGKKRRYTAGCVGITKFKGNILVLVSDYNCQNLDLYICPFIKW